MGVAFQQQIHVPPHSSSATLNDPRCDICNFTAKSQAVVLQHIRATHYNERYESAPQQQAQVQARVDETSSGSANLRNFMSSISQLCKDSRIGRHNAGSQKFKVLFCLGYSPAASTPNANTPTTAAAATSGRKR